MRFVQSAKSGVGVCVAVNIGVGVCVVVAVGVGVLGRFAANAGVATLGISTMANSATHTSATRDPNLILFNRIIETSLLNGKFV